MTFERHFVRVNETLVGSLMAVIFVLVFVNVVLRYLLGTSLAWVEEVARFLMIAATFLGAGLALRSGRLVAIELLQDALPAPARTVLRACIAVVLVAFLIALTYFGYEFVRFGWNKETMATQVSRGIPYLAIPLGLTFFVVHLLLFFRRYVTRDWEYDVQPDPDD